MKIGDKIYVLLPWYTQCTDDTGPYVYATVLAVKSDEIQVGYDTPYGMRDLWIDMDNLSYTQDM
jgi:hypothetical protein